MYIKDEINYAFNDSSVIEDSYKNYLKAGAKLSQTKKQRLKEINNRMSVLQKDFAKNITEHMSELSLHIKNKEDLNGLGRGHAFLRSLKSIGKRLL